MENKTSFPHQANLNSSPPAWNYRNGGVFLLLLVCMCVSFLLPIWCMVTYDYLIIFFLLSETERDEKLTIVGPDRFQSRWLGGWMWKVNVAFQHTFLLIIPSVSLYVFPAFYFFEKKLFSLMMTKSLIIPFII